MSASHHTFTFYAVLIRAWKYLTVPVPVPAVQEFQSAYEYGGKEIHMVVFGSVM